MSGVSAGGRRMIPDASRGGWRAHLGDVGDDALLPLERLLGVGGVALGAVLADAHAEERPLALDLGQDDVGLVPGRGELGDERIRLALVLEGRDLERELLLLVFLR